MDGKGHDTSKLIGGNYKRLLFSVYVEYKSVVELALELYTDGSTTASKTVALPASPVKTIKQVILRKWCKTVRIRIAEPEVSASDVEIYAKYSDTNILYYVFGAKLRILLTTLEDTTADIYRLKIPCEITQSADPEINNVFFQILLDIAESLCWPKEGEFETRRIRARDQAVRQVEMLNGKVK